MNLNELIAKKREQLMRVIDAQPCTDEKRIKQQEFRKNQARYFLEELKDLEMIFGVSEKIYAVPQSTLEKKIESADFVTVSIDGEFCKLVQISNFPSESYWLACIAPLSAID